MAEDLINSKGVVVNGMNLVSTIVSITPNA
jgi:hypothetical protein